MSHFAAATRALVKKLGTQVVLTSPEKLHEACFDSSKILFHPSALVHPRHNEDIGALLSLANKHKVPVTVRGSGTTLTGAAAPLLGGWVLQLKGWDKIRIDAEIGMAHVGTGALVADIQAAAEAQGWFYPPDPSSKAYCTIGGNIACNAGGMHGGKYGVTRDYVLALEGFLPTGEFVRWGTATKKFSAGFNLRDLWIGSEGMLGVITGATLRLIPKPAERYTFLAAFKDECAAFAAARDLFSQRIQPAICEFLDRFSVHCAESATGRAVFAGQSGRPVLLLELAGSASELRDQKKQLIAWAKRLAVAHRAARTREEAEELWAVRRKCSGAMFELGDSKLNEDIVIPARNYEKFARFLDTLRKKSGLSIQTFGHLADGNLHVNIMYRKADPAQCHAAEEAVQALMEKVVSLDGAISGEHGIGLAKTPFLSLQHSPAQIGAMKAVKAALDPNGILNPGKMFERFEVWKHPRLAVKLPWDHK